MYGKSDGPSTRDWSIEHIVTKEEEEDDDDDKKEEEAKGGRSE